jgi:hypothetical protein
MSKDPRSYVQELAENAQRYMRELRAENQAWRDIVTAMQQSRAGVEEQLALLQERLRHDESTPALREAELQARVALVRSSIDGHKAERAALEGRIKDLETRSLELTEHCASVEEQHVYVTNLYVATDRLHRTLDRAEVLQGIVEIIVNLVGSEDFGIFELAPSGNAVSCIAGFGIDVASLANVPLRADAVARSIEGARTFIPGPSARLERFAGRDVVASVPLSSQGTVFGSIVIFGLLSHKARFTTVDLELFQILSLHAGSALHASAVCASDGIPFLAGPRRGASRVAEPAANGRT